MKGRCTGCGIRLHETTNGSRQAYDNGVFPGRLVLAEMPCPNCQLGYLAGHHTTRPDNHFGWTANSEVMKEGKDYQVADCDPGFRLDGSKPLFVSWLWTPMEDDDAISRRLIESIVPDEDFRRNDVASLLVMSAESIPVDAYTRVAARFDMTILLQPHVTMGANGPYPSVRAERSITTTFSSVGLRAVRHYWPAYTLRVEDYVPLFTNSELAIRWGAHARKNFTVQTPEE